MDEIKVACPYCLNDTDGNYGATKCTYCGKIFVVKRADEYDDFLRPSYEVEVKED